MKVIFLDFDGVINNWNHFEGVDFNNVFYLTKIIELTGAKIVATTSNKYDFQNHGIKYENTKYATYVNILKEYGIDIFDVTPYVHKNREFEIIKYLQLHPEIEQFLILDDDSIISKLSEHQVFLDLYNGITEEHIIPSVNILNGKLGFYPPDFNFDETPEERIVRINKYHLHKK